MPGEHHVIWTRHDGRRRGRIPLFRPLLLDPWEDKYPELGHRAESVEVGERMIWQLKLPKMVRRGKVSVGFTYL